MVSHRAGHTYVLDKPPHACPRDTTTTKDLNSISCGILCTLRAIALQERNLTVEKKIHIKGSYTGNKQRPTQRASELVVCTSSLGIISIRQNNESGGLVITM